MASSDSSGVEQHKGKGQNSWLEMSIEIPGFRVDDALSVFPASMLTETLPAGGELKDRLFINRRFHSMLPALKSEKNEDPLFDDDWNASTPFYSKGSAKSSTNSEAAKPPVIVLAMVVGQNVIFDPCKEELVVVDVVLAVACTSSQPRIVSIRTIDPPSYLTPPSIPNSMNSEAPIRAGS